MTQLTNKISIYENENLYAELNESFYKSLKSLEESKQYIIEESVEGYELNEEVISATFIISIILAMPSLIKTIASSLGWIWKKIKKLFTKKEEDSALIQKLLELMDKWHHMYISTLRQVLRVGGVFKTAGIKDKEKQMKATEVVFYTIILGFAVHGGIATGKGIIKMAQHMDFSHIKMVSLESVLTAIKSNEVRTFARQLMGKV